MKTLTVNGKMDKEYRREKGYATQKDGESGHTYKYCLSVAHMQWYTASPPILFKEVKSIFALEVTPQKFMS
jgi:hypothetical protein